MKTCLSCHNEKEESLFGFRKNRNSIKSTCKECEATARREYYHSHRGECLSARKKWGENNKVQRALYEKEWYALNKDKQSIDCKTYYSKNRESQIRRAINWARNNSEKVRAAKKSYRERNPEKVALSDYFHQEQRRARKKSVLSTLTKQEWEWLLLQCDYKCVCCHRSDVKLTQDHIIPIVSLGNHSIDNIQPLCRSCNSKKSSMAIDYRPRDIARLTHTGIFNAPHG